MQKLPPNAPNRTIVRPTADRPDDLAVVAHNAADRFAWAAVASAMPSAFDVDVDYDGGDIENDEAQRIAQEQTKGVTTAIRELRDVGRDLGMAVQQLADQVTKTEWRRANGTPGQQENPVLVALNLSRGLGRGAKPPAVLQQFPLRERLVRQVEQAAVRLGDAYKRRMPDLLAAPSEMDVWRVRNFLAQQTGNRRYEAEILIRSDMTIAGGQLDADGAPSQGQARIALGYRWVNGAKPGDQQPGWTNYGALSLTDYCNAALDVLTVDRLGDFAEATGLTNVKPPPAFEKLRSTFVARANSAVTQLLLRRSIEADVEPLSQLDASVVVVGTVTAPEFSLM